MQQHIHRQQPQNAVLQIRVLVHVNRDHSNVRQKAPSPAHNVLLGEPQLPRSVKTPIVDRVVIALGQELDRSVVLLVQLDHPMDDRNVPAFDFEHHDFTHTHRFLLVGQEQQIPAKIRKVRKILHRIFTLDPFQMLR